MSKKPVPSPCVNVCVLNLQDICEGCYRSANEITEWMACDNSRKQEILAASQQRRKAATTIVFK